ncbi:MAG: hypothetical protein IJZ02_08215 [Clostridia bacterium]|nr:hypothetical protein [Clostridia bacterium]
MTATQALPARTGRRYRFSILRVLICGALLSVLVAACLYCKYTAIDFFHARLLEQESKTSAWILKQVSFALPWIVMCIFQGLVYCKHDRRDGIVQREMFWEVLLVTVFTYLILLPHLRNISEEMYAAALEMGADIPQTDGKVDQTFLMIFHEWFIRMAVPLSALLLFHSVRARRERDYPETEAEEPMMTRAEYDAMKLAEMARMAEATEAQAEAAPAEAPIQPETEVENHE